MFIDVRKYTMKTISTILLIAMINFIACSSTQFIGHDQSACEDLNGKVEGERVNITLTNDNVIIAENTFIGVDSTSWLEIIAEKRGARGYGQQTRWYEGKKWSVPTRDVKKIDIGNCWQGALGGLFYGFLVGAALGLLGGLTHSDEKSGFFDPDPEEVVVMVGILGAVVGLPIGLLVGGTDEYVLTDSTHFTESDE
jgi:hypothetical protein